MRRVEAARERDSHTYRTDSLDLLADGLADWIQDDETAVAEDRDGDDPSHEHHGELWMLLADTTDDDIGQADGGPRVFQDQANQGAEDDDDADAGKRAREASPDDAWDFGKWQTDDDGQQEGGAHQ